MLRITLFLISLLPMTLFAESAYDNIFQTSEEVQNNGEAPEYTHQGRIDRLKEEGIGDIKGCKDLNGCSEDSVMDGTFAQMVPVAGQMFSSFMGMVPNKLTKKSGETKEVQDYCGLIPQMTTSLGTQSEQAVVNNMQSLPQNPNNSTVESLDQLARTHKTRATTSLIQSGGWASAGACYVGMIGAGGYKDPKIYAKLAASTFLSSFYGIKYKKHKEYRQEIMDLAAGLRKAGSCSPHENVHCFCNLEPTSAEYDPTNYEKYCLAPELKNRGYDAIACLNSKGEADPNCNCKSSNSCLDRTFAIKAGEMDFAPNFTSQVLDNLKPLSNGSLIGGKLEGAILNANNASKKLLKKDSDKITLDGPIKLRADQKEGILLAEKMGIPKKAAIQLAGAASSQLANQFSKGLASSLSKAPLEQYASKVSDAQYGKINKRRSSSSTSSSNAFINPFAQKKKERSPASGGVEIEGFAQKAQRQAEVSKNKSRPLFEMISFRYRSSAWNRFQVLNPEKQ